MIKVGLIIDEKVMSYQTLDLINKSKKSDNYEISIVINQINSNKNNFIKRLLNYQKKNSFKGTIHRIFWTLTSRLDKLISLFAFNQKSNFTKDQIDKDKYEFLDFKPDISNSGYLYTFKETDINILKNKKLDVLIRLGSGILQGDILDVCRFGVLSFHHGDNSINRGGPPGFWEVYNKEESTGFIIQQLTKELDGGNVLLKGNITTSPIFYNNQFRLYEKSNIFMHKTLDRLGGDNKLPIFMDKKPYSYPLYVNPSTYEQFIYITNNLIPFICSIFFKRFILQRRRRWNVAYQYTDSWKDVVLRKSKTIKNPPKRYLADPFLFTLKENTVCFVEDYSYETQKGHIAAIELSKSGYRMLGPVIKEDYHLSYPFIFEYENEIYMCPESTQNKSIDIYVCEEFPSKWKYKKRLMNDVSAADTNIFYMDSKWWLLTNIDSSGTGEHCSELHIFYSDKPITENWIPHKNNPVIFDSKFARNGGLIIDNKDIFRVFQKHEIGLYGASMGIAKIEILNEFEYKEKVLFHILPKFFKNINGTHTFNYKNGIIAIDYAKNQNIK